MPYGTPEPGNRSYTLVFNSVEGIGPYDFPMLVQCKVISDDILNDDDLAPVFQKFVDLIENSPDFTLNSASRVQDFTEVITPTP